MDIKNNILETIGNTPLIKLNKLTKDFPCTVVAKVEYFNPGNSAKDRMAIKMIEVAEQQGKLKPGGTIIEGTSGNTGMGLALAACIKGYKCIFVTTDKQSKEKADILKAVGAEVIVCPTNVSPEDPKSYYSVAKRLSTEVPNSYHMNQYDNLANRLAHYESTGPEIWKQTEGKITHFVCTAGTGGTITGTAQYLKEKNPDVKIIGCQPQQNHLIQGWRNFEESAKPDLFLKRESVVDDWISVNNDEAFSVVKEVFAKDKLLISPSSAAVYACMKKYHLDGTGCVVGIFADDGRKFKSVYATQNVMTEEEFDTALKDAKYMSTLAY